jgi:hypothetical protein
MGLHQTKLFFGPCSAYQVAMDQDVGAPKTVHAIQNSYGWIFRAPSYGHINKF